ncbi:MAG TPA: DUF72 domain-containing protein [Candidatus Acidoferrales bacterium]|jgi:uncharacterized protein YecE (DUF72 family)|nr:DUF72 domain-containing protein [Candidatus Acidoferrales bacterium]
MPRSAKIAKESASTVRIGPAGWSYADWAGIVYPARKPFGFHEAAYLSHFFDTIEINTSFYHPVRPEHCKNWIQLVSGNPRFLFTAKLWQKFTHEADASREDESVVRAGFDVLRDARKLGAVLLQFPFSFHKTEENTAYLSKLLKKFSDYPLVVEVRHATWNDKAFYAMLHERGVGFCNIDQPVIGHSMKPTERTTARVGYIRLHGRRYDSWFSDDPAMPPFERYNYLYSEEELEPWAARIKHVSESGESTFVITNNHFEGKGIVNALQLIHLLNQAKVKIPEQLRQRYPELDRIATEPPVEPLLFPK